MLVYEIDFVLFIMLGYDVLLTIFTWALFVTSFALVANERVFRDCSTWLKAGLIVHIIAVRAFPPSEGCNILVSFESL